MNPEVSFKVGAVRASAFRNRFETKEGRVIESYSVNLHRRFQDSEGQWKSNSTFRFQELPQVALALQLATDYVAAREATMSGSSESEDDGEEANTAANGIENF